MAHSPPSAAHHRRIELDSAQDITYLHQLATTAAQQRLLAAFPPPPTSETTTQASSTGAREEDDDDELRTRVNALVAQFLQRTYASVQLNCAANGHALGFPAAADTSTSQERSSSSNDARAEQEREQQLAADYETVDARTVARIRELERQRERALLRVAALRRAGVGAAERRWREDWVASGREDEGLAEEEEVKVENEAGEGPALAGAGERVQLLDVSRLRRWDEVAESYARGLEGLVRLKGGVLDASSGGDAGVAGDAVGGMGIAGAIGRLEEARRVGEELRAS